MSEQEQTLGETETGLRSLKHPVWSVLLGPSLTLYRVRTLICPYNSMASMLS